MTADSTTRTHNRLTGRIIAVVLAVLGIVFLLMLLRLGWQLAQPGVSARTLGYTVRDDSTTELRFEVTAARDATVECEARAQAADGLDVGAASTVVGPADRSAREVLLAIPTRRRAAAAEVYSCHVLQ